MNLFNEGDMRVENGLSAAVKVSDWIKLMCLSLLALIPVVGTIVYLILYLYLAFSQHTAESIKNYLKASLIVGAVSLVFVIVVVLLLVFSNSLGTDIFTNVAINM